MLADPYVFSRPRAEQGQLAQASRGVRTSATSRMFAGSLLGCLSVHQHSHSTRHARKDVVWQQRFSVLPSLRAHAFQQEQHSRKRQYRNSRSAKLRCRGESQNGNGSNGSSNASKSCFWQQLKQLPEQHPRKATQDCGLFPLRLLV